MANETKIETKAAPSAIDEARAKALAAVQSGSLTPGSVVGAEPGWRYEVLDADGPAGHIARQEAELQRRGFAKVEGAKVAQFNKPCVYRIPQEVYDEVYGAQYREFVEDSGVQEYQMAFPKVRKANKRVA